MPYLASVMIDGKPQIVEREDDPYIAPSPEFVRSHRDQLLKDCDWTQVADAPVDQAAWATYRQALRDIPQQEGFPENVTWPESP
jgi:hypothetical protein